MRRAESVVGSVLHVAWYYDRQGSGATRSEVK